RRRTRRRQHRSRGSRSRAGPLPDSGHNRSNPMNRATIRSLTGLTLIVAAAACGEKTAKQGPDTSSAPKPSAFSLTAEPRQRIHLVPVQVTSFSPVIEATGNVAFNGDKSTQVLSPVSGPATRVVGLPGMNVTKGTPLAYVSSPDFAEAVANYRKAQT